MSRIGTAIVMLCAALATPVLGYWEHDGISVSIGEPDSASDPYGTWSWWYDGWDDVDSDKDYIDASGDIEGGADIQLYTDYGLDSQRSAYARNWVNGTSDYHWVGSGTCTPITVYSSTDVCIDISYYGYPLN